MGWVAIQEQEAGPQGSAVRESTSRSILLDPLYCFGFGKESLSSFLLLFSSLQEQCSLLFFLLSVFIIRAQDTPDPLNYFTNLYVP